MSLRRERMRASKRYRDGTFRNETPAFTDGALTNRPSMLATTGEYFFSRAQKRPPAPLPVESPLATWAAPPETGLRATWLGHSTVLLEIDGHRVLTDPIWSERISPVSFFGPRRFHATPVALEALPTLDAVLVSHDHYDHFDAPTLRALGRRGVPFVTSLGVGARLEALGIPEDHVHELDWWESVTLRGLRLTATPSRHFSGRSPFDRNRTLWSSWSLATERHRVFFSGDTGLTPDFERIAAAHGPFDLVMLEVGAFHPSWGDIHLGPENALRAHAMLGGGTFLPVHWGTFDLALHAWDEPIETLVRRAGDAHVITPRLGRAVEPSRIEVVDPWWRTVGAPALVPAEAP